ncbi:MAG: hypothetical protein JST54_19230 [Deltaproteobacteria bacterium]|nr:hypothetical protein [Deltaproteobacteria bacterium]
MRKLLAGALAFALAGCGTAEPLLRHQAAVDLSCAPEQLKTVPEDSGATNVSGCGHEARYVADRNGWQLESLDGSATPKPSTEPFTALRLAIPP